MKLFRVISSIIRDSFLRMCLVSVVCATLTPWGQADNVEPDTIFDRGKAIYENQCANCHGDQGEGVAEEYDEPLYGNRSLESLTRRIVRTMPEDDPDLCVGEDATAVSTYVFHSFYSAEARHKMGIAPH